MSDYATQDGDLVRLKGPIPEKVLSAMMGAVKLATGIRVRHKENV